MIIDIAELIPLLFFLMEKETRLPCLSLIINIMIMYFSSYSWCSVPSGAQPTTQISDL